MLTGISRPGDHRGNIPDLGPTGKVLDRSCVDEDELHATRCHAEREKEEEGGNGNDNHPIDVVGSASAVHIGDVVGHDHQDVESQKGGVEVELDEEFEGVLANDAADPGAEVVHLLYASVHF